MPQAKLSITVPDAIWIGDISSSHPDVVFQVVTSMPGEETGIGLVRLIATDPLPIITEIQGREDIMDLELLWKHDKETLLQIESSNPLLVLPAWRAGVPLSTPFDIQDGQATWELTTSSNRFSSLRSHLDNLDIESTIEYVRPIEESHADQLLTDRQQEVLLTAVDEGYYRTQREATLGDVANTLGIANATCSDILHRAEGHLVHWFVEEHMTATP